MDCDLTQMVAAELAPGPNADEVREGQLVALALGLFCAVVEHLVLRLTL
jgi:hypothetical protein